MLTFPSGVDFWSRMRRIRTALGHIKNRKERIASALEKYGEHMLPGLYRIETRYGWRLGSRRMEGIAATIGYTPNLRNSTTPWLREWVANRLMPPNWVRVSGGGSQGWADTIVVTSHGVVELFSDESTIVLNLIQDGVAARRLLQAHDKLSKSLPVVQLSSTEGRGILQERFVRGPLMHSVPPGKQSEVYQVLLSRYIHHVGGASSGDVFGDSAVREATELALELIPSDHPIHSLLEQMKNVVRGLLSNATNVPSHGDLVQKTLLFRMEGRC